VHKTLEALKGIAAVATLGVLVLTATQHHLYAQAAGQAPQKKVKDQGEYDLFNSVSKETDKAKQLQYLNQWVEKYPDSDYQEEQARFYDQLNQPAKAIEVSQRILAKQPKDLIALTVMCTDVPKLAAAATPDQLSAAEKAAHTMLDNLDALKPAGVTDDQWKQAKPSLQTLAKNTIEWIETKPVRDALDKKDYPAAEVALTKLVQAHPDNGQLAYQLGSTLVSEKDPNKYPEAVYEIARALEIGGLPAQSRPQVEAYLAKIFNAYHGADDEALKNLRQLAKASPLPPPDYKLETSSEVAARKEAEFTKSNPSLALWMNLRKNLTDPSQQYFDQMKGQLVGGGATPKLKGTIVDAKPACHSKELEVALSDAKTAEVTIKLDMPLKGKPATGQQIEWQGVPTEFSRDPFMMTMTAEDGMIEGLQTEPCSAAPPRRAVGKKK
jgi:tetratricopeptide (TPR) repeat protein